MEGDPNGPGPATVTGGAELIEAALEELVAESGLVAELEDRTIRLTDPVAGNPHLAVLRALGYAAKAGPVGAAAHGPLGVAAGVWDAPMLHLVRWTGTNRWVSAYKFPARGRPDDYLREPSGIPSSLAKGNWYDEVPDEIVEAFLAIGVLLDEPPFPVPAPPTPPPKPASSSSSSSSSGSSSSGTGASPRTPRTPKPRASRAKPPAPPKPALVTRTCTSCNLAKHPSQFVEGSDLCVDCR